jgi:hypothetical protein
LKSRDTETILKPGGDMSLQLPFFFTREAAVIWYQQGVDHRNYFDTKPTTKKEVMDNEKFCAQSRDKLRGYVERSARILFDHLGGQPRIETILDIGCGLGIFGLSIYRQSYHKPILYLMDAISLTGLNNTLTVKGEDGECPFTNDPRVLADFMIRNGIENRHLNILAPSTEVIRNLRSVDFVISTGCWFDGVPRDVYWESVISTLHKNSMIMVDVASKCDLEFLAEHFGRVEQIKEDSPSHVTRILLREPKWLL